MTPKTPPLALTMGDACGIGPEIIAKTLTTGNKNLVVFGSFVVMSNIVQKLGINAKVQRVDEPGEARFSTQLIEVIETTQITTPPPLGMVSAASGQAAFDSIVAAIAAAKAGPLALTMGDACGIGPEIIAKTLTTGNENLVVFGSFVVMSNIVQKLGINAKVQRVDEPGEARFSTQLIEVIETTQITTPPPLGMVSAASGQAAFDSIVAAIAAAKAGKVSGIVTAPINKEALRSAGLHYPGHTEILAAYAGAKHVAMMLANDEIRTVLVTVHTSLRKAIDQADFNAQMAAIRLAHSGGKALGFPAPRIAVAGLNPHAGEGGLFGDEEIRIIKPAINAARAEGINASGPWPGDTVYMQARKGHFDVVVAQYHDQGLIPVKYMGLEKGVNITLGLPFVRTSPDHGTAFDIAGKGLADHASLQTALDYAWRLAASQQQHSSF